MNKIIVKELCKSIKGVSVLNNINIEFESGKVYGLVGKNGSGKTMFFRALAGLIKPDKGVILYNEQELHKDISTIPKLGLVIENVGLYPEFTGIQNLRFLANINKLIDENEIRNAIVRMGLEPDDRRTFKKYSLGMKQRIVLAQAIMEKPDVILLDEPTNALDESGVELIRNVIKEEKQRGSIIVIASHSKEDIDLLCDKVFQFKSGSIVESEENSL